MVRAVARLAAVGSLITVLGVAAFSPAYADGALGLNGPTGEPLPWTLAVVVGLGGAAFLVRAVLRLRATPQTQRVGAASGASRVAASRAAQLVSSPDPAGSPPASNSSRASRSSADAVPAR
jgi:hypothetical protein